jgi:hypothetical protein
LYCIVLYCIVLYCIVSYCIVLYCIVSYWRGWVGGCGWGGGGCGGLGGDGAGGGGGGGVGSGLRCMEGSSDGKQGTFTSDSWVQDKLARTYIYIYIYMYIYINNIFIRVARQFQISPMFGAGSEIEDDNHSCQGCRQAMRRFRTCARRELESTLRYVALSILFCYSKQNTTESRGNWYIHSNGFCCLHGRCQGARP